VDFFSASLETLCCNSLYLALAVKFINLHQINAQKSNFLESLSGHGFSIVAQDGILKGWWILVKFGEARQPICLALGVEPGGLKDKVIGEVHRGGAIILIPVQEMNISLGVLEYKSIGRNHAMKMVYRRDAFNFFSLCSFLVVVSDEKNCGYMLLLNLDKRLVFCHPESGKKDHNAPPKQVTLRAICV
jgi:hypothetical protein